MLGSKAKDTKINKGQKGALIIVYNDHGKSLAELVDIVAGTTMHTKHLQFLITEVYKSPNHHNTEFMLKCFHIKKY